MIVLTRTIAKELLLLLVILISKIPSNNPTNVTYLTQRLGMSISLTVDSKFSSNRIWELVREIRPVGEIVFAPTLVARIRSVLKENGGNSMTPSNKTAR